MEHRGAKLVVRYCEHAPPDADPAIWVPPSWRAAIAHLPASKHASLYAKMMARRNFLASGGRLRSPDHWNTESRLPRGGHFYAIKVDRLRAYGWFSNRHPGVFYISHFAFKQGPKLALADTERVITNWEMIEETRQ